MKKCRRTLIASYFNDFSLLGYDFKIASNSRANDELLCKKIMNGTEAKIFILNFTNN